jgi:rubrerythrin
MVFNIDEVFKMAVQVEVNGVNFYTKAAENSEDPKIKKYFLELADMERDHIKIFTEMGKDFSKNVNTENFLDPFDEARAYLKAFIAGEVFSIDDNPADKLTGNESFRDILKTAIGLERDSIVFYLGIKKMVPEEFGKGRIDKILDEEMRHIAMLSKGII